MYPDIRQRYDIVSMLGNDNAVVLRSRQVPRAALVASASSVSLFLFEHITEPRDGHLQRAHL